MTGRVLKYFPDHWVSTFVPQTRDPLGIKQYFGTFPGAIPGNTVPTRLPRFWYLIPKVGIRYQNWGILVHSRITVVVPMYQHFMPLTSNFVPRNRRNGRRNKYCWTHGACNHSSDKCENKAQGHQDAATFRNRMGGNNRGCR